MQALRFVWAHIDERSVSTPDDVLVVEADGVTVTYAEAARAIRTWSAWLQRERARRFIRVAALLDNTAVAHLLRVAAAHAGVVYTSLNPLLRGKSLLDALDRSKITDIVVADDGAMERFDRDGPGRERIGALAVHHTDGRHIDLTAAGTAPSGAPERWPSPCHTLVYTSGTSGPAKPVRIPAELMTTYGRLLFGDRPHEWSSGGYYSPWHPAHVLGAVALEASVARGLRLVLRRKFDADVFWTDVVEHACRLTVLISVANSVFARRAAAPSEHPLEIVGVSPVLPAYRAFEETFGVQVVNIYGMTELGTVLTAAAPQDRRLIGTPSRAYRCRVVPVRSMPDRADRLDSGQFGELAVKPIGTRTSYEPGLEPASSWRDGWFHTGDLVVERDGAYRFVGRAKDSIRRHGRNISAPDLEAQVCALPGVEDCVCVAHPGVDHANPGTGDDEIRLFVLPTEPGAVAAAAVVAALAEHVPRYMVPRYVDVVSELPRTASGKLSRRTLRELPLTDRTFDRKRAGAPETS